MKKVLERELETYKAHKQELLAKARGKFVLIKGRKIAGVFEAEGDAINQGYERYGNVPFLVKEIVEIEVPITLTSSFLRF